MKQKLYTSINEFKQYLNENKFNETELSDNLKKEQGITESVNAKDYKRMVDLIQGKSDPEKVAKLIKDKNKLINRFVAGLKLSNQTPKLSSYSDTSYSNVFSEFGNKALELGATVEEIQQAFDIAEVPQQYLDMVSTDKMKGKKFDNRFVGFLSKALIDAGYDIEFLPHNGNAITHEGKDAMRRNGRKWTIGYKTNIIVDGEKYGLEFDAITDEGDGPTYYMINQDTSATHKIFDTYSVNDMYGPIGKRKFLDHILKSIEKVTNSNVNESFSDIEDHVKDLTDILQNKTGFDDVFNIEVNNIKVKKISETVSNHFLVTFDANNNNHIIKVLDDGESFYILDEKEYKITNDSLSDTPSGRFFEQILQKIISSSKEDLKDILLYVSRPRIEKEYKKTTITPNKIDTYVYYHINNGGIKINGEEDIVTSEYGEDNHLYLAINANHFGVETNKIRIPVNDEMLTNLEILVKQLKEQLKEKDYKNPVG